MTSKELFIVWKHMMPFFACGEQLFYLCLMIISVCLLAPFISPSLISHQVLWEDSASQKMTCLWWARKEITIISSSG